MTMPPLPPPDVLWPDRYHGDERAYSDDTMHAYAKQAMAQETERLRRALHEIAEEWAGAECGEPVTAQETYAIELAHRMYRLAVDALKEKP